MKITWEDISTHLVYSKLTSSEPNTIYKEIYEHLQYWIPSFIEDVVVTINGADSYYYDSKNKYLYIDYDNIWCDYISKYDMEYSDIQKLIKWYAVSTHNIEANHTLVSIALAYQFRCEYTQYRGEPHHTPLEGVDGMELLAHTI